MITDVFAEKGLDIKNIPEDVEYCQIVGTRMIAKISISIDFGQKFFAKSGLIRDGKYFSFNSMVDALNFMVKNGWEYVDAYAISVGNQKVYHYLLKRKS